MEIFSKRMYLKSKHEFTFDLEKYAQYGYIRVKGTSFIFVLREVKKESIE